MATLSVVPDPLDTTMVHFCGSPNEELRRKNGVRFFEYGLQRVRLNADVYLALGEVGVKANSSPYYDQRIVAKFKADSEAPSLHGHLHIGESAFERVYDNRFRRILQGVEMYYNAQPNQTILNRAIEQFPR